MRFLCRLTASVVSVAYAYSHYESGERGIPLDILCKLATYYNTSTDYLLNRTDCRIAYPKIPSQ
ncbi:MAG: helix-turn-helix transcriptional regulator [Lachnospiraceae bacterium]|nr:helix-turn-helix transcriptional regulator [Lachnospiraceae bacterium]